MSQKEEQQESDVIPQKDKEGKKLSDLPKWSFGVSVIAVLLAGGSLWLNYNYTEKAHRRAVYDEIINAYAEDYKSITDCNFLNGSKEHFSAFMKSNFIENKDIHNNLLDENKKFHSERERARSLCVCLGVQKLANDNKNFSGKYNSNTFEPSSHNGLIDQTGLPIIPEVTFSESKNNNYVITGAYSGTSSLSVPFRTEMSLNEVKECLSSNPSIELEAISRNLQISFKPIACLMAEDLGIKSASCQEE